MSRKKRTFNADFKTKIVLELLSGNETIAQISSKYEITPKSLIDWRRQFLENASLAFDVSGATKSLKEEINTLKDENDALAKKLGRTTIERDFLEKKLKSSVLLNSRKDMVETELEELSIARQCELLHINRSTYYYEPLPTSALDVNLMRQIDTIYTTVSPTYGYRMVHKQLLDDGYVVGANKVGRLMKQMGIQAIFPRKKRHTSLKNGEHKIYPYLLKEIAITRPNQVWSGDITYIPIKGGHLYLSAIIDWHTKAILAYNIGDTMDVSLATKTLQEALARFEKPIIFNTDQGSQYTSYEHTKILKENNIQISMNGKGRSIDNIAIERFFRTLKYDEIYLNEYTTIKELKQSVARYIEFYNFKRFHSAIGYKKPMQMYQEAMRDVA